MVDPLRRMTNINYGWKLTSYTLPVSHGSKV